MKTLKLSIVAMLLLLAAGCTKSGNTSPAATGNVSTDDAADMVAGSISVNSNGLTSATDDASNVGGSLTISSISVAPHSYDAIAATSTSPNQEPHLICGTTTSDSISRQSAPGAEVTYSYNLKYNFTLNCNSDVPDNLSSISNFSGSYSGPHISAHNTGSTIFTVAGLSPHATNFKVNGEYKRTGSFQSKTDTTNHGTYSIDIVVDSLSLLKPARTITGGSATVSVTGNVPKKGNFTYTGTILFKGDGTASLTVSGLAYSINLATGIRSRI